MNRGRKENKRIFTEFNKKPKQNLKRMATNTEVAHDWQHLRKAITNIEKDTRTY